MDNRRVNGAATAAISGLDLTTLNPLANPSKGRRSINIAQNFPPRDAQKRLPQRVNRVASFAREKVPLVLQQRPEPACCGLRSFERCLHVILKNHRPKIRHQRPGSPTPLAAARLT